MRRGRRVGAQGSLRGSSVVAVRPVRHRSPVGDNRRCFTLDLFIVLRPSRTPNAERRTERTQNEERRTWNQERRTTTGRRESSPPCLPPCVQRRPSRLRRRQGGRRHGGPLLVTLASGSGAPGPATAAKSVDGLPSAVSGGLAYKRRPLTPRRDWSRCATPAPRLPSRRG